MTARYKVRLVARNEGIEYIDERDIYRFNVALVNKIWRIQLPGSKGKNFQVHELTDDEETVILARIKRYLESKRYFGIVGPTFPAIVERREPASHQAPKAN